MASPHLEIRPDQSTSPEAWRLLVNPTWAPTLLDRENRAGSSPADLRFTARQLHNLTVELTDLPLDGGASLQQRPDRSHQLRTIFDQLLGSHGEDIELGTADHETEVLEKAADMVLEIALDLD
jgi:hypothetical protein